MFYGFLDHNLNMILVHGAGRHRPTPVLGGTGQFFIVFFIGGVGFPGGGSASEAGGRLLVT